jgi:hypothetical protein
MKLLSALGLLTGGFLLVPKGTWVVAVIFGVAKVQPVLGMTLFGVWLVLERWL